MKALWCCLFASCTAGMSWSERDPVDAFVSEHELLCRGELDGPRVSQTRRTILLMADAGYEKSAEVCRLIERESAVYALGDGGIAVHLRGDELTPILSLSRADLRCRGTLPTSAGSSSFDARRSLIVTNKKRLRAVFPDLCRQLSSAVFVEFERNHDEDSLEIFGPSKELGSVCKLELVRGVLKCHGLE